MNCSTQFLKASEIVTTAFNNSLDPLVQMTGSKKIGNRKQEDRSFTSKNGIYR